MRQEQIYSERRNSLISAPARSHAIFAFKNLGIEIQAIQQVYSLKTSFGDFDLTGNSDFKNSIRYYMLLLLWSARSRMCQADFWK